MCKRILLIGYMGAGKSTIGQILASNLGIPFIDSDSEIEQQVGKSIPEIFETQGEVEFRKLETDFIQNLSRSDSYVLSTGGGLPCFNDNLLFLNELGITIYLKNTSEVLAKRIINSPIERPIVKGKSFSELVDFIQDNLKIREVYYLKSNYVLAPEEQEVDKILALLNPEI